MIHAVPEWDKQVFYAINGFRSEFFDTLMPIFSLTWLLWVLGLAAFALWAIRAFNRKNTWVHLRPVLFGMLLILATAGITDIVTRIVKDDFGRLRPYQSLPYAHFQTKHGWRQNSEVFTPVKHRADSFFSGHAAHSMAVAVGAATVCPPLAPLIYAMPVVVGYSRIYLGKHYPSDIMGGWAVGACIALLARRLTMRIRGRIRVAIQPEKDSGAARDSILANAWSANDDTDEVDIRTPSSISQQSAQGRIARTLAASVTRSFPPGG